MKKTFVALISMLLIFAFIGCTATPKSANASDILRKKGLEMVENMNELAASDEYISSLASVEDMKKVIAGMPAATPVKAVYSISVDEKQALEMLFANGDFKLSATLDTWLKGKVYTSIPTYISGQSGALTLAATSVLTYSTSFVCETLTSPVLYLYCYEGDYCVMVTFIPGQDGAVSANAVFVPVDAQLETEDGVGAWLKEKMDYIDFSVSTVK